MLTHFLTELSSSDFSHVFKESTGMTPLQFVTRQRITLAQQLIRETSRSLNRGRDRSPLHQSKPFRAGLQTGNRPYAERLPAAPLKREYRKSCEFTGRAAASFTRRHTLQVFCPRRERWKNKNKKGVD